MTSMVKYGESIVEINIMSLDLARMDF